MNALSKYQNLKKDYVMCEVIRFHGRRKFQWIVFAYSNYSNYGVENTGSE